FKEPYKATNKKEWEQQVNQGLTHCDKLTDFGLWLDWTTKKLQCEEAESGMARTEGVATLVRAGDN
ncbi:hypothetical protein FRC06_010055, partial [Ceratobasidium sp. 370]